MAYRSTVRRETPRRRVAELFSEAADDAERAIETMKAWRVRIGPDSRLTQAAATLRDVAANRQLPVDRRERQEVANALYTTLDFADAARALPPERVASLRSELEESLRGSLTPGDLNRRPWQLQSQHLVLGILHSVGLNPRIPIIPAKKRQKRPDFLVERGVSTYGIEVKRLESRRAGAARLSDANNQLFGYDVTGAVIIDATDIITAEAEGEFETQVVEFAEEMTRAIWVGPPIGYAVGFSSIMVLVVIARGLFETGPANDRYLNLHNASFATRFAFTENSLLDLRSRWLRDEIQEGLERVGYTRYERNAPSSNAPPTPRSDQDRVGTVHN